MVEEQDQFVWALAGIKPGCMSVDHSGVHSRRRASTLVIDSEVDRRTAARTSPADYGNLRLLS
jgi:hypothetical protein